MKKVIKARISDELLDDIEDFFGKNEGHRNDPVFLALVDRIQGQVVELVITGNDAFEKIDDNYWLPDCCWQEVSE